MVYVTYAHKPEIKAARDRSERRGWGRENLRWVRATADSAGADLARELERELSDKPGTAGTTIVNAGFAGALDGSLQTGQVVIVERFSVDSHRPDRAETEELVPAASAVAETHAWPSVGGLTVTEPVLDPARRARLHRETGAAIVDMEGFHLARTARTFGLDLVCLKVITDRADEGAWTSTVGEASTWARILGEAFERLVERLYDPTDSSFG